MPTEIEKMFYKDIKDKKTTGRGIYSKKGSRGYVGKMVTPVDLLKGKARKEYMGGEVVTYSMYEIIMSLEEFKKLSFEEKKKTMIEYRKRFKNSEIAEEMGMKEATLYYWFNKLGITGNNENKKPAIESPVAAAKEEEVREGLYFTIAGEYGGAEIAGKLEKVAMILSEDELFTIKLELIQR